METYKTKRRLVTRTAMTVLKALLLLVVFQPFQSHSNSCLMAGNVTASIDRQGDLEIRGDHDRDGNQIEMFVHSRGGRNDPVYVYVLMGNNGTTINGQAGDSFALEDVTGDVNINMGFGGDTVEIHDWYVGRTRGHISQHIDWPHREAVGNVDNSLTINTGDGDDILIFHYVYLSNNLTINTGGGNDILHAQEWYLRDIRNLPFYVGGNISIDTGDDDDLVNLGYFAVAQQLHIETRGGDDTVRLHACHIGLPRYFDRILNIDTGHGDDDVILSHLKLNQQLHIETHNGNDYVWIHRSYLVNIDPELRNRMFGNELFVDTGNGQYDTIRILETDIGGNAVLSSGTGTNVFFLSEVNTYGHLDIEGRSGKDYVYMYDTGVWGNTNLNLEGERDFVFMDTGWFNQHLSVDTGHNNDLVHGQELTVRGSTSFDGGPGRRDYLQVLGGDFFDWNVPVGFEGQRHVP